MAPSVISTWLGILFSPTRAFAEIDPTFSLKRVMVNLLAAGFIVAVFVVLFTFIGYIVF